MKRKHSVGWFSSYDRGLDTLLGIWPKVLEKVPDATLDVYYGWDTFRKFHSKNPERMKWQWQMIRKFNELGIEEHGRVSHTELATVMKATQVWAYPTSFAEISCITAMKAQAAGMQVVTSGYAALQETIFENETEIEDIHDNPKALQAFTDRLIEALLNPLSAKDQEKLSKQAIEAYNWSKVAELWDKALCA